MKIISTLLKAVGCWFGPALFVLAIFCLVFPPAPFGDVSLAPALVGAIVSFIAALLLRKGNRKRTRVVVMLCAFSSLALWSWRLWDGKQGYYTEQISFQNRGATLAGTLYLPERSDPAPGIVWVHGSGPQTRGMNESFVTYFARSGFAVLIFDKRGVGESTGTLELQQAVSPTNIDLLASDAAAALDLLAKRPEVRKEKIGFLGISQAGWITPRAAVLNSNAAFMLLLSGPVTTTHTQMRYEYFHLGEPTSEPSVATFVNVFKAFGRGNIPEGMTADEADAEAQKMSISLTYSDYDPASDLRALNIPGLWLLGDADWMVPSGPTIQKLDDLRAMGKPYEYQRIPDANHGLFLGPRPLVRDSIASWLARVIAQ